MKKATKSLNEVEGVAEGFEVFSDMCYFDLWAVRPVGCRDFHQTAHFQTCEEAVAWSHDPDPAKVDPRYNS